jgi:hypothetical protein
MGVPRAGSGQSRLGLETVDRATAYVLFCQNSISLCSPAAPKLCR